MEPQSRSRMVPQNLGASRPSSAMATAIFFLVTSKPINFVVFFIIDRLLFVCSSEFGFLVVWTLPLLAEFIYV